MRPRSLVPDNDADASEERPVLASLNHELTDAVRAPTLNPPIDDRADILGRHDLPTHEAHHLRIGKQRRGS